MADEVVPGPGNIGAGSRIAGYRIDEEIGRGGMAIVFRAHDPRLERRVALKVLAPDLAEDDAFRQRFIRESRAAAAVDHPHIIPIFEAGEADGALFIAMRLVRAGDVQTLIDQHGPLPAARACRIVTQVAAALDAAHAYGLVHRDVKPANMLLDAAAESDQHDHVYLSDFGLSKRPLGNTDLTSAGQFLGTLNYVSPEQIEGRPVDGRSDLYALACSAYAMLAGAPPFRQDDSMAIMWAQLSTAPPRLTARRQDLPPAVDAVMATALAKAPAGRYPSCRAFAAALRHACGLEPGAADPAPPVSPARREATQPARAPGPARQREPTQVAQPAAPAHGSPAPATPRDGGPANDGPANDGPAHDGPPTSPSAPARQAGWQQQGAGGATQFARAPAAPAPGPVRRRGLAGGAGAGHSGSGGGPGRRSWLAIGAVAAAAGLAAGWFLLGGKGGKPRTAAAALAPPGCTTRIARAAPAAHTAGPLLTVGGRPFDVATAPGGFAFVSTGNGVTVLSTRQHTPAILWASPLPHAQGEAITRDHRYLLVTDGSGADVFRVADLEQGPASPIGALTSPGQRHAVEVALTPDSRFAFITFQDSAHVGVFSLQRALQAGFGPADLTGLIPVGAQPIGVAMAPGGRTAYVTSRVAGAPDASGGVVNVIDVARAEMRPASAVVEAVAAGCRPARVTTSPSGQQVWVSAAGSNALLAYSAPKLLSDPRHALLATVAVGSQPLGLTFVDHGTRMLIADSNRGKPAGGVSSLAVVDAARALAGRPALLGYLPSGLTPRQFALEPHGRVLVTDTDSAQVQTVDVTHLP